MQLFSLFKNESLKVTLTMKLKYLNILERIVSMVMMFLLGFLAGGLFKDKYQNYPYTIIIVCILFAGACIKMLVFPNINKKKPTDEQKQ